MAVTWTLCWFIVIFQGNSSRQYWLGQLTCGHETSFHVGRCPLTTCHFWDQTCHTQQLEKRLFFNIYFKYKLPRINVSYVSPVDRSGYLPIVTVTMTSPTTTTKTKECLRSYCLIYILCSAVFIICGNSFGQPSRGWYPLWSHAGRVSSHFSQHGKPYSAISTPFKCRIK